MIGATSKGGILGFVIVFLAFLNTAQCLNFKSIFEGLSIAYRGTRGTGSSDIGRAENCAIFKNRRKCLFNTKTLRLPVDKNSPMQLTVSAEGRTIQCNKKFGIGKNQWYGSCDGDADDANFITRFDKSGIPRVFGSIHVGNEICHIGPNIDGDDEILCIPESDFPAEDDSRLSPKEESPENLRLLTSDLHFGFVPTIDTKESQTIRRGSNHHDVDRQLFDDSGGNIDVIVVWTKLAECRKAGLEPGCTVTKTTENMMRGLIDLAVAETNTAYALSGIFTTVRLVHAYRDPDYVEGDDFFTSLEHVTTPNDGFMDSVHSKRALYGADAVHMIAGASTSCGIAWSGNPSADSMFAVTQYACATGYYSFGHEIGHNLGMFHDRGTENTCNEPSTFNYGYRHPNAEFRTILSYDCNMNECDNMPNNGCTRIQRYSNSNSAYTYNGKPIGDAKRDNAKQVNSVRARVAAFFPAMNCQSDIECDDIDSATTDTCNATTGVCAFTSEDVADEAIAPQQEERYFWSLIRSLFERFASWLGFARTGS